MSAKPEVGNKQAPTVPADHPMRDQGAHLAEFDAALGDKDLDELRSIRATLVANNKGKAAEPYLKAIDQAIEQRTSSTTTNPSTDGQPV